MKNKIIFLLLLIMMFSISIVNASNAKSVKDLIGISNVTGSQLDGIKANTILGTIVWLGYIVSIGMFIWVGIKYVMSGAGEKAKAKETLVPILVGAFLISTGATITATVFGIFGHG